MFLLLWHCTIRKLLAPVAQLDRVLGYEPRGREFESLRARHKNVGTRMGPYFFVPGVIELSRPTGRPVRAEAAARGPRQRGACEAGERPP